jgi:hypothetical protein
MILLRKLNGIGLESLPHVCLRVAGKELARATAEVGLERRGIVMAINVVQKRFSFFEVLVSY